MVTVTGGRQAATPADAPAPGPVGHAGQVGAHRVQVNGVPQPVRERGHGGVRVVPGPVEPPVHHPLHPPPHRANNAAAASVDAATAHVEENRSTCVASSTSPAYTPTSSPVTSAYPSVREISRSMSYNRYRRIAIPMDSGMAAKASAPSSHSAELVVNVTTTAAPNTTPPLASHLSCWRRSPEDRRQLATWRPMAASHTTTRVTATIPWIVS